MDGSGRRKQNFTNRKQLMLGRNSQIGGTLMRSILIRSIRFRKSSACGADGTFFFQAGSAKPGPHQSE